MSEGKKEYLRKRRKSLIIAILTLIVFGGVLFGLSVFNKKMNAGVVSSGGLQDITGKLKDSLKADIGKRGNILDKPVKVRFSFDKSLNELTVKGKLKIGKKNIENAVFFIKEHGEMLYSRDFVSDDENIFCRGVMKKGEELFFVYFCNDKRD